MADVIHPDQSYTVPGRSIFDNLFLVRDLLELGRRDGLSFSLLSLDQEKAFDRVDHGYLLSTLQAFGFGSQFEDDRVGAAGAGTAAGPVGVADDVLLVVQDPGDLARVEACQAIYSAASSTRVNWVKSSVLAVWDWRQDRSGTEQSPATADTLWEIVEHHSLVDIWRDHHLDDTSTFTFVQVEAHWSSHSWLDRIYLSRFHLSRAHSSSIRLAPFSDHHLATVTASLRVERPEPAYCHFNNSLLEDEGFMTPSGNSGWPGEGSGVPFPQCGDGGTWGKCSPGFSATTTPWAPANGEMRQ
ncbi:unnamed protein product [Caretta caretta]